MKLTQTEQWQFSANNYKWYHLQYYKILYAVLKQRRHQAKLAASIKRNIVVDPQDDYNYGMDD